jgi:hypothetical protein
MAHACVAFGPSEHEEDDDRRHFGRCLSQIVRLSTSKGASEPELQDMAGSGFAGRNVLFHHPASSESFQNKTFGLVAGNHPYAAAHRGGSSCTFC